MPAFLTHWYILIETAHRNRDAGSDLGSLIVDPAALHRRNHGWSTPPQTTPASAVWDTGPLPAIDFRFPGSDISAMAFLGALAPDMLSYHRAYLRQKLTDASLSHPPEDQISAKKPQQWSELFHSAHSGEILMLFLEQLALVPSPALRSQALAFALGYVSHIATDIALNPWLNILASHLKPHRGLGPHAWAELLLDEYLATSYFEHPRYSLIYQPWNGYIEPAARNLNQPGVLAAQLLQLLALATEVYQPGEEQAEELPNNFLAGLKGLRLFLAGRGRSRWLIWQAAQRRGRQDLVQNVLADTQSDTEIIALDKVLGYATHLSERLCRGIINYYTALRNPHGEASERSSRRATLVSDLRHWDLQSGYDMDDTQEKLTPSTLHNWVYFMDLWEQGGEKPGQLFQQILPVQ